MLSRTGACGRFPTACPTTVLPLPSPATAEGRARRTGVEIEFGGLDETRAADVVAACLGGQRVAPGRHARRVVGSAIGSLRIELDTRYRKGVPSGLKAAVLDLSCKSRSSPTRCPRATLRGSTSCAPRLGRHG